MVPNLIKNIESDIISSLRLNYNLKLIEASFSKGYISKYILLDRTKNIHSYYELGTLDKNKIISRLFTNKKIDNVFVELSKIQYSTLDRPSFLILRDRGGVLHIIDIADIRILLLENKYSFQSLCNQMVPILDVIIKIKDELKWMI